MKTVISKRQDCLFSTIIKRDGSEVDFDSTKIQQAIRKAGEATSEFDNVTAKKLTEKVIGILSHVVGVHNLTVENVQDVVETVLMTSRYKKTAKAYIIYRAQHAEMRALAIRASLGLIDRYLDNDDWRVKENSNMGYSLQGLNNYVFSETSKTYWLNKIYPREVRDAYESGDVHIHDLGTLSVYCVGWDLMDLLTEGFCGVAEKVQSAPAKHFRTALGQIVNFMYTLQGEAAGAIAFSNFDTLLAPFIRYDHLTEKEVKQCIQEFMFNMNVPTRVGFQTPFSNITLDLTPSPNFKNQHVVIGGVPQKETYQEFQAEMDMLNQALFSVFMEGDARGRVFTFPIPTVNITKDFDWNNSKHKGLWEITAKYGIPYFSNFINSDIRPEDTRSMCCRLRLNLDELDRRGGGLFGANALTGSIGVVTINMPRIGYLAKDEKDFFTRLDRQMDIAKESLEIKRKVIERFVNAKLYPYTAFYLRKIYHTYGEYWKNHFSTIGLVGLNEAIVNFLHTDIGTNEGRVFAEKVLVHMRDRLIGYQKETDNLYNLEATPAEGTAYRFALQDRRRYPNIVVANKEEVIHGAEPFYTNSSHLPTNYTDDVFEALQIQDSLQTKYTGGTVMHIFLGERVMDPYAVQRFVKKVCEQFQLPYFTLTPTFSICPSHGYLSGSSQTCEFCGEQCEVYSRVVGYLRPVGAWNLGKQAEWSIRKTYTPFEEKSAMPVPNSKV